MNLIRAKAVKVFLFACAIWILSIDCSFAQVMGSYESNGGGSSWINDNWSETRRCNNIKGYAEKPVAATDFSVSFEQPTLGSLGHQCTISGRLSYRSEQTSNPKPVNWFQGVSVHLLGQPGKIADWSEKINSDITESDQVILNNDGSFSVKFDLRKTKRDPTEVQDFQIAISMAKHFKRNNGSQGVIWSSRDPVMESTIQKISIPASPEIPKELRLIDEAYGWPFSDPDMTRLIKAVNGLQPLGKEKALSVLSEYVELTNESYEDGDVVFWIIRLLFEPADLNMQIPSPAIAVYLVNRGEGENAKCWPLSPIELIDDVPLMVGHPIGMGGQPEHPSSHIRWAQMYGVIRDKPLFPATNPLKVADRLLRSEKFLALPEHTQEDAVRSIRDQALQTLGIEVPNGEYGWPKLTEEVWNDTLDSQKSLYQWNPNSRRFEPPAERD